MTKDTYIKAAYAAPSVLLAMCLFVLGTIIVPEIRKIEANTDLQSKAFGDRLTTVEKQYQATLDRTKIMAERLENMELRLTLLSIIPPTQALKLETTGDLERLITIMKENQ